MLLPVVVLELVEQVVLLPVVVLELVEQVVLLPVAVLELVEQVVLLPVAVLEQEEPLQAVVLEQVEHRYRMDLKLHQNHLTFLRNRNHQLLRLATQIHLQEP